MNFLIAEDSVPVRKMIRRLVANTSDTVYECADGAEAFSVYLKHKFDWVLMDIQMPKMDGIAATRKIRAADPQAKIIVVTTYDDPVLRTEAEEAGASAFVVKDDLSRIRFVINERKLMNNYRK